MAPSYADILSKNLQGNTYRSRNVKFFNFNIHRYFNIIINNNTQRHPQ